MTTRITGRQAIEVAELRGLTLHAYTDPTSEGGEVTVEQARERAAVDPSLVYCDVEAEDIYEAAEIDQVEAESEEPTDDEGPATWVTARVRVGGVEYRVRLYAAPASDGRPGLEPCGDCVEAWCDERLYGPLGIEAAGLIARHAIGMAS